MSTPEEARLHAEVTRLTAEVAELRAMLLRLDLMGAQQIDGDALVALGEVVDDEPGSYARVTCAQAHRYLLAHGWARGADYGAWSSWTGHGRRLSAPRVGVGPAGEPWTDWSARMRDLVAVCAEEERRHPLRVLADLLKIPAEPR